jgi:PIN domain nuclease of toxin-antitoxin system
VRLLLDTHALIWFLEDDPKLSQTARAAISDAGNQSYISDATAWEAGIKLALSKLKLPVAYEVLSRAIGRGGFSHTADLSCPPTRTGVAAAASP